MTLPARSSFAAAASQDSVLLHRKARVCHLAAGAADSGAQAVAAPLARLRSLLTCGVHRVNQGASVLHVHYITPLLHKHENAIDSVLEESMKKVRGVASWLSRAVPRPCLTMRSRCGVGRSYIR